MLKRGLKSVIEFTAKSYCATLVGAGLIAAFYLRGWLYYWLVMPKGRVVTPAKRLVSFS